MDNHQLTRLRLKKLHAESHEKAMQYIDIVTASAVNQMEKEGVAMDPYNIDIKLITEMAAKNLNIDFDSLYKDYTELMIFESMITMSYSEYLESEIE